MIPQNKKSLHFSVLEIKIFIVWLLCVCIWNFGVPGARPIYDVVIATGLSILSMCVNKILKK